MISKSLIDGKQFENMYEESVKSPEVFWKEQGQRLDWIKNYTKVKSTSFAHPDISIKWFEDGVINACVNCVDRHLESMGDEVAIIWESDDPACDKKISYRALYREVNKLANVFKGLGLSKGDRIVLYLPMIPQAAYACLLYTSPSPRDRG